MANPTAKAQIEDDNWLLPILVLIAILIVAISYVKDDLTTGVTQFALASAAAGVLGWGYWLAQKARAGEFQVLRDRLFEVYVAKEPSRAPLVPNHPHCTHVVAPLSRAG